MQKADKCILNQKKAYMPRQNETNVRLDGKIPTRSQLVGILFCSFQPFADVVGNCTCQDRKKADCILLI